MRHGVSRKRCRILVLMGVTRAGIVSGVWWWKKNDERTKYARERRELRGTARSR